MFTLPQLPQNQDPHAIPPSGNGQNEHGEHHHTLYSLIDHGRHAIHNPMYQSLNALGDVLVPYVQELQEASPTTQARVIVERYLRDIDAQSSRTVRYQDLQRYLEDALYKDSHVNPYLHTIPPESK